MMRRYLSPVPSIILFFAVGIWFSSCSTKQPATNTNTPQNKNANANANASKQSTATPLYEGYIDIATCDVIHGWAWNQSEPDAALTIEIYDGNALLATLKANEFRENLVTAGRGTGKYAYNYMVPPALKDGKPHSIRAKIAGTDYELGRSPQKITCTFP